MSTHKIPTSQFPNKEEAPSLGDLPNLSSSPPPPSSNVVGEQCRTPISEDHKIPEARSCPPTPRKRPVPWNPQKRKVAELHFFESMGHEEVESFFRDYYGRLKKRCTSV